MSSNIKNRVPYLREQRSFPREIAELTVEIDKAYTDIANAVNSRGIALFNQGSPVLNGERWFLGSRTQQAFRQLYSFSATGSIAHGINFAGVSFISPKSYGYFTDGSNFYGCLFASNTAIAGQVSFYVTPTNIVILSGAGAPSITQGLINLEWVVNS